MAILSILVAAHAYKYTALLCRIPKMVEPIFYCIHEGFLQNLPHSFQNTKFHLPKARHTVFGFPRKWTEPVKCNKSYSILAASPYLSTSDILGLGQSEFVVRILVNCLAIVQIQKMLPFAIIKDLRKPKNVPLIENAPVQRLTNNQELVALQRRC